MINQVISYFDLQADRRGQQPRGVAKQRRLPVVPQYIALLLGMVVQPLLAHYVNTGHWSLQILPGWLVASVIGTVVLFPSVYTETIDASKPIFVQLCVIFTAGLGWQSVLQFAVKVPGS